jgi:thiol-disulfide isomerase/thioredoxin
VKRFIRLAAAAALAATACFAQVPRPSADYTIVMPDGSHQQLSRYKGKIIVLEFLKVTCPACQEAARTLQRIQKDYAGRDVQVLGVSIDNNAAAKDLLGFASQFAGDAFPVGNTTTPIHVYSYLQHSILNPNFYVPQIVIIDRGFTIREYFPGGDPRMNDKDATLRAVLDKLVAERGTAQPAVKPSRKAS